MRVRNMITTTRAPLNACRSALIRSFRKSAHRAVLDKNGYVSEPNQNLIEGVRLDDFEADLRQGDGNELGGSFALPTRLLRWLSTPSLRSRLTRLRYGSRVVMASQRCISSLNARTGLWADVRQTLTYSLMG